MQYCNRLKINKIRWTCFICLHLGFFYFLLISDFTNGFAQPKPGDIFREYHYSRGFGELDPCASHESAPLNDPRMISRYIDLDLEDAVKSEIAVEFTQHIGTSEKKFKVNDHNWIDLPLPVNTPGRPECYHHEFAGNPPTPIPLEQLRHGKNKFQFTAGPQICHNFNWGLLWVYGFTVRIYYDSLKTHPTGNIVMLSSGDELGEFVVLKANAIAPKCRIKQVDFISYYKDVDWEGDGTYQGWHYLLKNGQMRRNLGTTYDGSPYSVVWHTEWIPDQDEAIKIMDRIVGEDGMCTMTSLVDNLKLNRNHSVKLYPSSSMPENFSSRLGITKKCKIIVNDPLRDATEALLWVPTHVSRHYDEKAARIGLNNILVSDYFGANFQNFDYFPIPVRNIHHGENEFYICSDTEHHMAEVNWPGPVLLIKYKNN